MAHSLSDVRIDPAVASSALRKVTWRLIPFLCLLYVLNLLDRSNVIRECNQQ